MIAYSAALQDRLLWYDILDTTRAGCSAEALYRAVPADIVQSIAVCTANPTATVLPPIAGVPCTYFIAQQVCSPPPPAPRPPSPPAAPAAPMPPPAPRPPPPLRPPMPPRPPVPPGAGPCVLLVKAYRPAPWPPATACSLLLSAMAYLCVFNAEMLPGRDFQCFDDGSRNGQIILVGTAATSDDAAAVAANFAQRQVASATLRLLGGMQCGASLQLEGLSCGLKVRWDSTAQPELFSCFPSPPSPPSPPPLPPSPPSPPSPPYPHPALPPSPPSPRPPAPPSPSPPAVGLAPPKPSPSPSPSPSPAPAPAPHPPAAPDIGGWPPREPRVLTVKQRPPPPPPPKKRPPLAKAPLPGWGLRKRPPPQPKVRTQTG